MGNIPLEEKFKLVADTIRCYPLQLKQSWDEISGMHIPEDYKNIENIVFCGMGGSALGARIVDSYALDQLRVPLEIFNEYRLPAYANEKSLVVVSSYSGSTEETLEVTNEALQKRTKLFGITTGGKLSEVLTKEKLTSYIFDPKHNPSKQPRMSIGYATGCVLALFNKLGLISVSNEEVDSAINSMNEVLSEFHENSLSDRNLAYKYAELLYRRIPILVASEHLIGTAHTVKNQFNESAKTFCVLFDIPELNHHLMEGLKNPAKLKEFFTFVFINSNKYTQRVQKRYPITSNVVEKNGVDFQMYSPRSENKLSQVFETLVFGSFVVYFLTKKYSIDPMEIPWVDYFKQELAKS